MGFKEWIKNGLNSLRANDSEDTITKIKKLLKEADLSHEDLDAIISSIDGKLWEEEIKKRIEESNGSKLWTMQELEALYEDEISQLQSKLDQLVTDRDFLLQTNLQLSAKTQALSGAVKASKEKQYEKGLLQPAEEEELYVGETRDVLLDALEEVVCMLRPKTRRYDIITSVLEANEYDEALKKKREKVKYILKDASGATDRVTEQLKDVGLKKEKDNGHVKYSYYGDPRYQVVLSKTSSDHRGGKNIAGTIIDLML